MPSTQPESVIDVGGYEHVLTSLEVGVCVWELEIPNTPSSLRLVHCNPAAGVFLGVDHTFVQGKRIHEGFPGSEKMPLAGIFTKVIETGEPMKLNEIPYKDKYGEGMFSIDVHPLPNKRCCVEFTNITERKKAEKQVAERTEELSRALAELWSEMDLARKIQTVLVPTRPSIPGYEVAAEMRPAQTVGGDYVDVFEAGGSSWMIIGDVSGHGISAGLIMMMIQTSTRTVIGSMAREGRKVSPSAVLTAVNAAVSGNLRRIGKDQYMTVTVLRLDGDKVVHAGLHQDILIHRAASRQVVKVETTGVWIGVMDDVSKSLVDQEFSLEEGDSLLLFTDGITESKGASDPNGQGRLEAQFSALSAEGLPCEEIVKRILDKAAEDSPHDDCTLLAARRRERGNGN
ncbi:MAG: SpoIIE family protein phosphatase [Myxococcaceae bacterium]